MNTMDELLKKYNDKNRTGAKRIFDRLLTKYMTAGNYKIMDSLTSASVAEYLNEFSDDQKLNINGKLEEAFRLAYPTKDIADLTALRGEELQGFINGIKGKYFEMLVADRLNTGETVSDLKLSHGQAAFLADNPTNPGWDIKILNENGSIDKLLQVKATASEAYVAEALDKYPNIDLITTEEVGDNLSYQTDQIHATGISNEHLDSFIKDSFSDQNHFIFDGRMLIPFLPFLIITLSELRRVQKQKQTIKEALRSGRIRSIKSAAAICVGYLFSVINLKMMTFPATFLTRLSIDRFQNLNKLSNWAEENQNRIQKILSSQAQGGK